jgi:hypothetical protein
MESQVKSKVEKGDRKSKLVHSHGNIPAFSGQWETSQIPYWISIWDLKLKS